MRNKCYLYAGGNFAVLILLFAGLVSGIMTPLPATGQEEASDTGERSETSGPAVRFYRSFLKLYLQNFNRIDRLKTLRSAGASAKVEDLKSKILQDTEEKLERIRNAFREAQQTDLKSGILRSMEKIMTYYPMYVEKVVTNWTPSREQVLQRRRLSSNEIIDRKPELAQPALLRRVILGELTTSVHTVSGIGRWFQDRIQKLRNWINNRKKEVYPLYVRLLARAERVMQDDRIEKKEKRQKVKDIKSEWKSFWRDLGKGKAWQNVRFSVNQLSSFFRDRDYLPGYQNVYKRQIQELRRQLGSLQKLYIKEPFMGREKRLRALLRLSRLFARQVSQLGGQRSDLVMERVRSFVTTRADSDPSELWQNEDGESESLTRVKTNRIQETSLQAGDLQVRMDLIRDEFKFPFAALRKIAGRLGQYGEKGKETGERIREMVQLVEDRHHLLTDGTSMMKEYHDELQEVDSNKRDDLLSFERSFQNENGSSLQKLKNRADRTKSLEESVREYTEDLLEEDVETLVANIKNSASKRSGGNAPQ